MQNIASVKGDASELAALRPHSCTELVPERMDRDRLATPEARGDEDNAMSRGEYGAPPGCGGFGHLGSAVGELDAIGAPASTAMIWFSIQSTVVGREARPPCPRSGGWCLALAMPGLG